MITKSDKRYSRELEICKDCNGSGSVLEYSTLDLLQNGESTLKKCATCNGSGRVYVVKEITIKVHAFDLDTYLKSEKLKPKNRE